MRRNQFQIRNRCRNLFPAVMPFSYAEGEREILVAVSKLAATLARCQDKTDEERNRGESCGKRRGKTIQIGKGQGARAEKPLIRKYHGHSHLLEAVKRECTYVHPHFMIFHFRSEQCPIFRE